MGFFFALIHPHLDFIELPQIVRYIMNKKSNPYFYWWTAAITLTIISISIILYTYKANHDGDFSWEGSSSLIQAIFGIIVAFSTISSFIRSDMQVQKAQDQINLTQRMEFRHSLVKDNNGQNLNFFNVSKYPIIIRAVTLELPKSTQKNDIIKGIVISPGEKASISLGLLHQKIKEAIAQEVKKLKINSAPDIAIQDLRRSAHFLLRLEYNYGGSGSITYHKLYEFCFEHMGNDKNSNVNLELKDFHYKIPTQQESEEITIDVHQEWSIPLPFTQK